MKKKINWLWVSVIGNIVTVVCLIVALVLSNAGGRSKSYDEARSEYAYEEAGAWYAEDSMDYDVEEEAPEAEEKALANGMTAKSMAPDESMSIDVDEESIKSGEKLVYTANISLETKEYKDHKAKIYELAKENGVIIENMSEDVYNTTTHGSFTLRVPYDKYETVFNALCSTEEGWMVRNASSNVQNMTKQYSKLTAQIDAYEQERETLLGLLKDAENVTETLEIQDRLAWLNSDLQYYYNERENIDADVEMSTIYLDIQEIKPYKSVEQQRYTFGERISMAFQDGLDAFVGFLQDIALFFVENWLFLCIPIAAVIIIVLCVKRAHKKAAKRPAPVDAGNKEEKKAE